MRAARMNLPAQHLGRDAPKLHKMTLAVREENKRTAQPFLRRVAARALRPTAGAPLWRGDS